MIHLLKACFNGTYRFTRTIQRDNIVMSGTVVFNGLENGTYQYNETGLYVLHGVLHDCFQTRYFIIKAPFFMIQKRDGEPLHEFQIPRRPALLTHTHQCNNDTYKLNLSVVSADMFKTDYTLHGPKKNQTIQTVYTRYGL